MPSRRFFTFRSDLGMVTTANPAGIEVTRVEAAGFASDAALMPGDMLVQIGGISIYSRADLWSVLRAHADGDKVTIDVVREGVRISSVGTF